MSEIIESRHDNGQLYTQKLYKDGELEESRRWFSDGTLSFLEHWKNGKQKGIGKSWYVNGQIREETIYQDGIMNRYRSWHENGRPWVDSAGPDGEYKLWHPNGELTHFYCRNDKCIDYQFSWKKKRIFIKLKKLFTSNFSFLNTFLISDLENCLS